VDYRHWAWAHWLGRGWVSFCSECEPDLQDSREREDDHGFRDDRGHDRISVGGLQHYLFRPRRAQPRWGSSALCCRALAMRLHLVRFDRADEWRNYIVFATWSAALFCRLPAVLPRIWQPAWIGAAAIAATFAGLG